MVMGGWMRQWSEVDDHFNGGSGGPVAHGQDAKHLQHEGEVRETNQPAWPTWKDRWLVPKLNSSKMRFMFSWAGS